MDEMNGVAAAPQGFGGAQAIGDVAAEGGFLAQPGNVSQRCGSAFDLES
jgi:hypothetical protein